MPPLSALKLRHCLVFARALADKRHMGIPSRSTQFRFCNLLIAGAMFLACAAPARAQGSGTPSSAVGERYYIEFSATWWNPLLTGSVSSDRLGLVGSTIDFVSDLGFNRSRQSDMRLVLRPAKKHKLRLQYTPTDFSAQSVLTRDIAFAGQVYPISLPVESLLTWTVLRLGYEWDFLYKPRGYAGVLLEVRKTDLTAAIDSIIGGGEIAGNAPFPAIGFVGRAYPLKELAINVEVSGLKITDFNPDHAFKLLDMEISATFNVTRNAGVSAGWRRMNTSLVFDTDRGVLDFSGLWFGGVVRY